MNRLLWDENVSHHILRALRRARPDIDVVTVQQLGLSGADDNVVLDHAAKLDRILVTHDKTTMPAHLASRTEAGLQVPRVVIVRLKNVTIPMVVDGLADLVDEAESPDWHYLRFIP